jgi:nucleoside-diphosphate-sugar epimerase
VGTAAAPANPHLAAKAEVERIVAASGLEHAILRCTHVLGPGSRLLDLLAAGPPVPVPGDGRQRVAPVWVGDVATAIAAADDTAVELAATWSLAGPAELAFDDLVDAVHGGPVAKRHLAGGDGGPRAGLTPVQASVLAADSLADPALERPPGLLPTPLAAALASSAGPTGRGLPGRLDG